MLASMSVRSFVRSVDYDNGIDDDNDNNNNNNGWEVNLKKKMTLQLVFQDLDPKHVVMIAMSTHDDGCHT